MAFGPTSSGTFFPSPSRRSCLGMLHLPRWHRSALGRRREARTLDEKKRAREERFTAAVFRMNSEFNVKNKKIRVTAWSMIYPLCKGEYLMRSLTKQYEQVALEGLTAARYRAEFPPFSRAGGEAPRSGVSIWVPAVVHL